MLSTHSYKTNLKFLFLILLPSQLIKYYCEEHYCRGFFKTEHYALFIYKKCKITKSYFGFIDA